MATALIGAAGEHFVAYRLSAMGYPAALTRGGSPAVDLMVGDLAGNAAVSLQVKTSSGARREYKRQPENNRWEWDVGSRGTTLRGESIFYAFVDLNWGEGSPDVFIVPSAVVAAQFEGRTYSRNMFWIAAADKGLYLEAWQTIAGLLAPKRAASGD